MLHPAGFFLSARFLKPHREKVADDTSFGATPIASQFQKMLTPSCGRPMRAPPRRPFPGPSIRWPPLQLLPLAAPPQPGLRLPTLFPDCCGSNIKKPQSGSVEAALPASSVLPFARPAFSLNRPSENIGRGISENRAPRFASKGRSLVADGPGFPMSGRSSPRPLSLNLEPACSASETFVSRVFCAPILENRPRREFSFDRVVPEAFLNFN